MALYDEWLDMTQRLTRRTFLTTSATGTLLTPAFGLPGLGSETLAAPNDERVKTATGISADMPWQRRDEPVLSSTTTRLEWCKTYCYSPHVIRTAHGYRMYYIGRTGDSSQIKSLMGFAVGMATSEDGLKWEPYGDAPVLTVEDVPWGAFALQTPYAIWDEQEQLYKLWFIGITEWVSSPGGATDLTQRLGYATSVDGIQWDVHPEPIFESGRRPCVHKEGPGRYRMWMNSRPSLQDPWNSLYQNVYEFQSEDGIGWTRGDKPVLRESDKHRKGCIYPFVCRDDDRYFLWYGAYPKRENGGFQIYLAESADGTNWLNHDARSAFPTSQDRNRFDSIYVSTPCMLVEPDRYLLYYSAVSWTQRVRGSYYQHIGVAVCPRGR